MKQLHSDKEPTVKSPNTTTQSRKPSAASAVIKSVGSSCGLSKETRSGLKVGFLWVAYVLLGSVVFIYLERTTTVTQTTKDHHHWGRFKELVYAGEVVEELFTLRNVLLDLCPHPVINHTFADLEIEALPTVHALPEATKLQQLLELGSEWSHRVEEDCAESFRIIAHVTKTHFWSLVDSIYFTMTAVTTIGYGHIYPKSRYGRLFCVLYSLVGVPLTCILMAKSSEMLSNKMLLLYTSAKKRHQRNDKSLLYGITVVYLTVGFIVFMFLPAVALVELEDWTYEDALYYTFITLSTIGFGDLVAGYTLEETPYGDLYKMAIIAWIMIALGYWFLLLNFLQKALKSKVPRKIKQTFKSKKIAKQAEFFRQLVRKIRLCHYQLTPVSHEERGFVQTPQTPPGSATKVRTKQQKNEGSMSAASSNGGGVVALMVEVAGALTAADDPRRSSIAKPHKQSLRLDCSQALEDSDSEVSTSLTLADLLDVNVVVRSESVPTIRSFVAQTSLAGEEYYQSFSDFANQCGLSSSEENNPPREVTLPLREVLQLVSLVASIENQVVGVDSSTSLQDMSSQSGSMPSTVTSFEHRESAPLLKDIFMHGQGKKTFCNGIKLHPRTHKLSQKEEDEIDEMLHEVLNDYSEDDDDTDTEGDLESQMDDDDGLSAAMSVVGADIEAGNYSSQRHFGYVNKR